MILLPLLLLQAQAGAPTVGDTIWLTRSVPTPPGAEVRPAPWSPDGPIALLGSPVVRREGDATMVAYPAVAWEAGSFTVTLPGPVVIRADGVIDSLSLESRTVVVASVLPADRPPDDIPVQPAAGIVAERITSPWPVAVALLAAAALYAPLLWWWRRRGPPVPPLQVRAQPVTIPLAEWSEAGESRAVAAVAARHLRAAIAGQLPGLPQGVIGSRLVRVVAEQRPGWPAEEIGTVLRALEAAQYAEAPASEVVALAQRAGALRQRLEPRATPPESAA
jgi:hypothetical protein